VSSLRSKVAAAPRPLKILMVVAFIHALAWTVAVAPLTGPDEANHAAYIQHVAETGHGVQFSDGSGTYSTQLDRLFSGGSLRQMNSNPGARPNLENFSAIADGADKADTKNGTGPNPVANNPPLYYFAAAAVYRLSPDKSLTARLFLIRVVTALSLPVLVLLAWLIGAELFVRTWPRALMAALVALQPKLAFMCAVINPDALLIVLTTLTLLLSLRLVKHGATPSRMAWLGIVSGAAVLTHGRGITAVLLALLAGSIALLQRAETRKRVLNAAVLCGGIAVPVIVALLYTRAHNTAAGAFGGQVASAGGTGFTWPGFASSTWQFYFPKLPFMHTAPYSQVGYHQIYIESFFSQQGGLEIVFHDRTFSLIQKSAFAGLISLLGIAVWRFRFLLSRWREVVVLAGAFVLLIFTLHFTDYRSRAAGADILITGRYLLPGIAIYGAAIAFVLNSLPRKIGVSLGGILIASNVVLAIGALGLAVERLNA
jgi:4-amino-4-deoxy-L-arabinose transferase-like glycosyltransferase